MLKGVKQKMNLEEEAFNTLNYLFDKPSHQLHIIDLSLNELSDVCFDVKSTNGLFNSTTITFHGFIITS